MEKLDPAVFDVASALLLLVAEEIDAEEKLRRNCDSRTTASISISGAIRRAVKKQGKK